MAQLPYCTRYSRLRHRPGEGKCRPLPWACWCSPLLQSVGNPKRFACRARPIRRSQRMSRSERNPINRGRGGSRGESALKGWISRLRNNDSRLAVQDVWRGFSPSLTNWPSGTDSRSLGREQALTGSPCRRMICRGLILDFDFILFFPILPRDDHTRSAAGRERALLRATAECFVASWTNGWSRHVLEATSSDGALRVY